MKSLFPNKFNWSAYFLLCLFIRIVYFNISWFSFTAAICSLYVIILLFNSIGTIIPTRHLLSAFMCVQFFVGPLFAYNGLDDFQYFMYKMRIPESEYFTYALPAVLLFIIGLHIKAGNNDGEIINENEIQKFVINNKSIPPLFIVVGFISSIVSSYFSSDFAFVFYLLGGLKFIGLFLFILGYQTLNVWATILVIGSIISSSFGSGMFHDLLTWLIYTISIFAVKYRFNFRVKLVGFGVFVVIVAILQILKGSFRQTTNIEGKEGNIETFAEIYQKKNEEKGVLSFINLAESNVRINQGFIITNIMTNVPDKVDYAKGEELYEIIEAAILPRILAPNKLNAGDRRIFVKYSGIPLTEGTSMGLSSVGDAYINFGIMGGAVFMFFLGLLFSVVLNYFKKYSFTYPSLILFVPLVFYYPIRPDCELQTILGHLVKSCFLVFMIIQIWKPSFKRQSIQYN